MVPFALQRAVHRTWRAVLNGASLVTYDAAVKAALAAIAAEVEKSMP
jgi:hypothetical protein